MILFKDATWETEDELLAAARTAIINEEPWKSTFPLQRVYTLKDYNEMKKSLDSLFELTAVALPHMHIHKTLSDVVIIGDSDFRVEAYHHANTLVSSHVPFHHKNETSISSLLVISQGDTKWGAYCNNATLTRIFALRSDYPLRTMKVNQVLMQFIPESFTIEIQQFFPSDKVNGILTIGSEDKSFFDKIEETSFLFKFFTAKHFILNEVTGDPSYSCFGRWQAAQEFISDPAEK